MKKIFSLTALLAALLLAGCSENGDEPVAVTGVSIDQTDGYVVRLDTLRLTAAVTPANAADPSVTWWSSDETMATVDAKGNVKALKDGQVNIIVTSTDGNFKDTCPVTINWMGRSSFRTDRTWTVGNQVWSDEILAQGCRKTTYNGGTPYEVYCDCVEHPYEGNGDLFSWNAVNDFSAQLCPDGWRVPSQEDYVTLNVALGGQGDEREVNADLFNAYVEQWGAEMTSYMYAAAGFCEMFYGRHAVYWTATSRDKKDFPLHAWAVRLLDEEIVRPADYEHNKGNACPVRCVKDK